MFAQRYMPSPVRKMLCDILVFFKAAFDLVQKIVCSVAANMLQQWIKDASLAVFGLMLNRQQCCTAYVVMLGQNGICPKSVLTL